MSSTVQASIIFGSAIGGIVLGLVVANVIRMKDYGWKLGLIFCTIALATSLVVLRPINQGIDLRGGVILIYEVDQEKTNDAAVSQGAEQAGGGDTQVAMGDLIQALTRRINPGGMREVVIRPYGDKQVEIIIPDVAESEIDIIKKSIVNSGFLKFRIVANRTRNAYEWDAAERALESDDEKIRNGKFVRDENGELIGEWVQLARKEQQAKEGELPPLRLKPEQVASMLTRELIPGRIEAFTLIDPLFNVEGKHLRSVRSDFDQNGRPCINFQMNQEGSVLFGGLTGNNLPNAADVRAPLAIIMDDQMLSAPGIKSAISSNGVIEGDFKQEDVAYMVRVLRAGKLPAVLQEDPISENEISPLLGEDTIRKGFRAIVSSLIAVLIFMVLYYRFSGFVACLALLANLVLVVGMMIMIKAAFTLPGLAGLVLTVGMSVDANVLIFERIREELNKGAALRMAIRNGFGRATSTVVDANLTTLIAAMVLYAVGTETIKGFAITLILGILVSLYTAIFCSRAIFEISERKGWIRKLTMSQAIGDTNIDFLGKRRVAFMLSTVAIIVGLSAATIRGRDMLDIDFTGGTSVQVMLKDPMPIADVRSRLLDAQISDSISVAEVKPKGQPAGTVYKIDTSLATEDELQQKVEQTFSDSNGVSLLKSHEMSFTDPTAKVGQAQPQATLDGTLLAYHASTRLLAQAESPAGQQDPANATATKESTPAAESAPAQENAVNAQDDSQAGSESSESAAATTDSNQVTQDASEADGADDTANDKPKPKPRGLEFRSESNLTFDQKIGPTSLQDLLANAAEQLEITVPQMKLSTEGWDGVRERPFDNWTVEFTSTPEDTRQILTRVQTEQSAAPIWLSSSKIGSKVAGDMQTSALAAIFVSLIGIVGYIWLRFQRVAFGLAAVVALVHDVAITLGAVALSYWIARVGGFLLVDEFKISLPIVAAFLTIIGYSLNDTIVVFDRIREVKGKSPELTVEMINRSINQTLGRTLLTSITTLIVVCILYTFGGQGIHGFAFALLIGVLVGTYSSIFVASPVLLWMSTPRAQPSKGTGKGKDKGKGKKQTAGATA